MVMSALGGFAGGLAQGINSGMQLHFQGQQMERLKKRDERDAELDDLRKDQYTSEKEVRDRRNNALRDIAAYHSSINGESAPPESGSAPMQTPAPQAGLAANTSMPQASAVPGTLAAATQPQQQQEEIPPAKILEKGMVTGMYSPKALTDIANIWAKHGLQEEGIKYMNQAYDAQKRGGVRAAMAFMQNNPGSAAEALKGGGIEVEGLPVKVKPDDPNDMNWKINVKGQGEQTINVRDWLKATMDPEEFFKAEDRRVKEQNDMAMDERRQKNVERKTDAEIGFLKSRSQLAEARAENPGGTGGLRASRSSESAINTSLKRRGDSFDRVSSVKNEEGKFEIDPMKRQELDSAANQYLTFIENKLGEELDSRDHNKFTDVMVTYPVGGTPEQEEEWREKQLFPRFGLKRKARATESQTAAQPQQAAQSRGLAPGAQPAGPKAGSLAALKERERARSEASKEMDAAQKALRAPNLNTEQKKALALKAQEIATRRDALK